MDVLPPPEAHELLDDEGVPLIPHVLPGNARQARVGEYVSIAKAYVALREGPVLLRATCIKRLVACTTFLKSVSIGKKCHICWNSITVVLFPASGSAEAKVQMACLKAV